MFKGADAAAFARVAECGKLTRFGADCYAYGLLAAGFIDLVLEASLKPYDFCAMVPIVEGAGGVATDWRGADLDPRLGRPCPGGRRPPRPSRRRSPSSGMSRSRGAQVMRRVSAILVSADRVGRARWPPPHATTPGMSLFGDLKYGPDFEHFDYVNPDAPKGGTMRLSAIGTFDTLNPYVVKGVPAAGIGGDLRHLGGRLARTSRAANTASSPKRSSSPPDKLSVLYTLRKEARFHDGSPMTPEDVIWTFETLRDEGPPVLPRPITAT